MFRTHVAVINYRFFDKTQTITITRTIGAAKHMVNHFHKSVNDRNELERRQRQTGIAQNALILDCPTRGDSTYDNHMFQRLIEKGLAIYAVLHDQAITKPSEAEHSEVLDLTDDLWTLLEAIVPVLKPLYMSTRLMCSEKYPAHSGIYPVLFSLIDHHLAVKECDCPAVARFKTNVVDDLKFRYRLMEQDVLCNSLAVLCAFLDSCYKSMPFLTHQRRTMVHDRVLALLNANEGHAKMDSQRLTYRWTGLTVIVEGTVTMYLHINEASLVRTMCPSCLEVILKQRTVRSLCPPQLPRN